MPKPRGVGLTAAELHRAGHSARRAQTKQEEEKVRAAEKKKKAEEREEKAAASGISIRKSKLPKKPSDKEKEAAEAAAKVEAPPVKCFGTEVLPDFEAGKKVEAAITDEDCIWDRPIHYELQVNSAKYKLFICVVTYPR